MRIWPLIVSLALGGSAASSPLGSRPSATDEARAAKLIDHARGLPDVSEADAEVAARAALMVESPAIPAELLVAIAWGESRFIPTTVTGHACGLLQTATSSRATCELLKIPLVGMLVGRIELEAWLHLARGDLYLALLGNACGVSALRGGCEKGSWPGWVLHRARALGLGIGPRI